VEHGDAPPMPHAREARRRDAAAAARRREYAGEQAADRVAVLCVRAAGHRGTRRHSAAADAPAVPDARAVESGTSWCWAWHTKNAAALTLRRQRCRRP